VIPTFDIVLLAQPTELAFLVPHLKARNPNLIIKAVSTIQELRALDSAVLRGSRLISFVTAVIVPGEILDTVGHGAFNFHPGPPEYPGWAPAHFALYAQAKEFGVTFHCMTERVDAGLVLDVRRFPISPNASVISVEELALAHLAVMFLGWAGALAGDAAPLPVRQSAQWTGRKNSRRAYSTLCDIPLDISKEDLERRVSIFGDGHFGISPSVRLHGYEFKIVPRQSPSEPTESAILP
jgi:Formyl transferase